MSIDCRKIGVFLREFFNWERIAGQSRTVFKLFSQSIAFPEVGIRFFTADERNVRPSFNPDPSINYHGGSNPDAMLTS